MAHPQVAVFARMAKGGEAPKRVIFGQATKLSRSMHDIRYSEIRDEIYMANPFAQAILTFRGSATGNEAPVRVIQGPKTRLESNDKMAIDDIHNEIIVGKGNDILVFPLDGNGDVAPMRVLRGPQNGWKPGGSVGVDPIHNLIIADGTLVDANGKPLHLSPRTGAGSPRDSILIFDRTANGDVKPLRVIRGPRTGIKASRQMQVYPKNGYIVIADIGNGAIPEPEDTSVAVWSINDNGDVPPRPAGKSNPNPAT